MWTSKIVGKRLESGALYVDIHFVNGEASIARTIDLTGGSLDVLSQKVQDQLNTLNTTDTLATNIVIGDFTPDVPDADPKGIALANLRQTKELVSLGVIKDTDPQVADALTAFKDAVSAAQDVVDK